MFILVFDENPVSKQNSPRWVAAFCGVTSCLGPIKRMQGLYELIKVLRCRVMFACVSTLLNHTSTLLSRSIEDSGCNVLIMDLAKYFINKKRYDTRCHIN